jgi:hypothetical protein
MAPLPAVGWPVVRSGGQAAAQAPVQALVVAESFENRYRVRPRESTRIWPRLLLAAPTAAGGAVAVLGGVVGEALALPWPLLPQAAAARTMSGTAAAVNSKVLDLRRIKIVPFVGDTKASIGNPGVRTGETPS